MRYLNRSVSNIKRCLLKRNSNRRMAVYFDIGQIFSAFYFGVAITRLLFRHTVFI